MTYENKNIDNSGKNKPLKTAKKQSKKREFKPPKKITEKYLYNSGLAYLQRYPASTHHFKAVMGRKINKSCYYHKDQDQAECIAMLEPIAQKFKELGLLDDAMYLRGMVTSLRRRGLSTMIIKNKLRLKGYKAEEVLEELSKFDEDEFQITEEQNGDYEAALIYARKKRLGPFDQNNRKTPEKSMAAMARAGYSYDIIKKILDVDIEATDY